MEELIYHELEREADKMKRNARVDIWEGISEPATRYFDGFGDRIIDKKALDFGNDSTVYLVKLKDSENRTQLVKVYDGLRRAIGDKDKTIKLLKNYYEILGNVRNELNGDNNPLKQKCIVNGDEYSLEYSVAQNGILVEKNGEIGSWIRNWLPGKNFQDGFREHKEKWEIIEQVQDLCDHLTELYGFKIKPIRSNYKVSIYHNNKVIKVVFTDLADSITEFMDSIPRY